VTILEDDQLAEIYYEDPKRKRLVGNIYKGIVKDVLNGLSSAFVDVGEADNLFVSAKEINDTLLQKHGHRRGQPFPIGKILRSSQELLVQVKREGISNKNPQGTTRFSLAGRYWVFLPKDRRLGASRRIEDLKEIERLKAIARELKRPDEGLIARTASVGASRDDLERDFNYLLGTWKGIEETAEVAKAPKLIYQGLGLIRSILRDRLLDDIQRVIVDEEETYQDILEFLDYLHLRSYKQRVELYRDKRPLFERRNVEEQLKLSLQPRVPLPGGGSLIIAETEALTAIDVNTGRDTQHRDQELAILNTNLEAACEIPRQLRLRKISGIIVVDFVDMKRRDSEHKLIRALKEELKKDRVPTDFIDFTALGLAEITRKRETESLADHLSDEILADEVAENNDEDD
jgi:ribonuclease G